MQSDLKRTIGCGELRKSNTDEEVVLNGWIHTLRDHGGVVFASLRDRSGIVQIVFGDTIGEDLPASIRPEFVVAVKGTVRMRPDEALNPDMPTGDVEVLIGELTVLNPSEVVPFEISVPDEEMPGEKIRLKYRYLDLRRPSMQRNIILRHRLIQLCRRHLDDRGFIEIETPFLTKSTPEGARDFLVPSRMHHEHFYALPQSPQLFKQLLMVAGFEQYFQIVRCFRDEDLRGDRQPEFTQLDLEMSFINENDIRTLIDGLFKLLFKELKGIEIKTPVPLLSYAEAMEKWGTDRPDLRYNVPLVYMGELMRDHQIPFVREAAASDAVVAIAAPENGRYSRKEVEKLLETCKFASTNLTGMLWFRMKEGKFTGPGAKAFPEGLAEKAAGKLELENGDLVFVICSSQKKNAQATAGYLRTLLAKDLGLAPKDTYALTWITDFPLFEETEEGGWTAVHHPFTSPREEDLKILETGPGEVKSQAYDIVINGAELGGGSIRIHDQAIQKRVFNAINLSDEEAEAKFGFLLEGLKYGAPPHGGIALGLDRVAALFAGEDSIRDVIPFPKTHRGSCLLTGAPSTINEEQLTELGLKLEENG